MGSKISLSLLQVEVRGNEKWYIDSACSCHMTGNANQLSSLHKQSNGCVALGDKRRREILGTGETKINENIIVKQVSVGMLNVPSCFDDNKLMYLMVSLFPM